MEGPASTSPGPNSPGPNSKGELIAACRSRNLPDPTFASVSDGPGHAPHFRCTVTLQGRELGHGEGRSKRDAERAASAAALQALTTQDRPAPTLAAPPAAPARWPIYADVLSQALLVAHERREHGALQDVARDAAVLYCAVLSELGQAPQGADGSEEP